MKIILITGGAGFIGSNLAAALAARGKYDVVVCDRLRMGGKWRNLAKHEIADIIAPENLPRWLESHGRQLAALFHMGAISSTVETDADLIFDANFHLSMRLWEWCAEQEVPFIYASSAATYGDGSRGFDDDASLKYLHTLRPLNAYGWSKHSFDVRIARLLARKRKAPPQWAGLKFFNVYGPNEYHKGGQMSVAAQMFPGAQAHHGVRLFKSCNPRYPDGGQLRDFVYVKDCVSVMLWLLDNPKISGLFNIGTGTARSFADLAQTLFAALGHEPRIKYVEMPEELKARYQYFTEAKMTRLRKAGYKKRFYTLEQGIRDYVRGYLNTADPYF